MPSFGDGHLRLASEIEAHLDKTLVQKKKRDVHLWGRKHPTTTTKATTSQSQLQMFVFHVC